MVQPKPQALARSGLEGKVGQEVLNTRFGRVAVNYDDPTYFEKGMLGMPEKQHFYITDFPVKKFPQFRLLQSLEDHDLSFILMPLALHNEFITADDLLESAKSLGFARESLEVYLVVNVYRESSYVRMSVNVRAPIFVNGVNQRAEQCVLRNNNYMVRQMLKGDAGRPVSAA